MRRPDNQPLDPVTQAELEAIDATLRGDAVEPVYADLAEIALLLEAERPPAPREEFIRELDARVALRFQPNPAASAADGYGAAPTWRARVTRFARHPAMAVTVVAAMAVVALAVFVLPNSSSGGSSNVVNGGASASLPAKSTASSSSSASTLSGRAESKHSTVHGTGSSAGTLVSSSAGAATPKSSLSGRKVEQSTQIELSTHDGRIDTVSQELLNAAAAENTIVERSHVSSASGNSAGSFATFTLSVPDGNLQAMMDRLSSLQYANVVSRQQSTQDVTDQYNDDKRDLADAKALRTSLLKQLEDAYTTGAIDSLKAQIKNAEAEIRTDESRLNKLAHATSYTTVSVQVNAENAPGRHSKSSGFTIGQGAHDGLHVLVVAAAAALIVLATLIPVALVAALIAWIAFWVRQRRRERALDHA